MDKHIGSETDAYYHFYGSLPSFYSAKGRAYMQWKRLPYIDHGASGNEYASVIIPRTGKAFIPVVVTPQDEVLQDTCDIFDVLEQRHPERPILPADPKLRFVAGLLEYYADECLIYPGLHMRWHYPDNAAWVVPEFARFITGGTRDESANTTKFAEGINRYCDGLGMQGVAAQRAARAIFDRLMARLEEHFKHAPWLLGATPSLADIALMGPIFGHWYRDPYPAALMRVNAPRVCSWVERMNMSNAAASDCGHALLPSMVEVLREVGAGFGKLVADCAVALDAYMEAQPDGAQLPRIGGGPVATELLGTPIRIDALNTYWAYKQQRVRDCLASLPEVDRRAVHALLEETGCSGFVSSTPHWRVSKNATGWLVVEKGATRA